jgi:hypothetical protein
MSLPNLRVAGSDRNRRVSISKKMDTVSAAAECGGVRTPAVLLAATQIGEVRKGEASTTSHHKRGMNYVATTLYQYHCSVLNAWDSTKHLAWASDGGRISGAERQATVFSSSERVFCSWAPPIVPAPALFLCFLFLRGAKPRAGPWGP